MTLEYLPIKELTRKYPLSGFQIRRLKKIGLLRFQSVVIQAKCDGGHLRSWPLKIVWEGDVQDFLAKKELAWISVGKAAMVLGVSENAVRYWLNNGLVRYKKENMYMVCKEDCESYQQARLPLHPRKKQHSLPQENHSIQSGFPGRKRRSSREGIGSHARL